jgi:hypothetical protein
LQEVGIVYGSTSRGTGRTRGEERVGLIIDGIDDDDGDETGRRRGR